MSKQPKIGIVIVTYNAAAFISDCLHSVLNNTYDNFEIVVIDNDSKDNTVDIIKKKFKNIHVFRNKDNYGYAAASNSGIKYFVKQKAVSILLLNPDTIIHKTLLEKCSRILMERKKIGVVGTIITYINNPKKIWFAGGTFNSLFCFTRHPNMNKMLRDVKLVSKPVDFITGACMMIRTDILKSTNLLPENYFLYFEDTFFCRKVIEKGYTCYLLAKPLTQHLVSASTGIKGSNKMSVDRAYYFARNPLLYIKYDVQGWRKYTNIIGQFCIRFPYYLRKMIVQRDMNSIRSYIKGMYDGFFQNYRKKLV
jgi:GT2 family glycosyltransferase